MKLKRIDPITAQANAILDGKEAASRQRALVARAALDAALKANPDGPVARSLAAAAKHSGASDLSEAYERHHIDPKQSVRDRAFSAYLRSGQQAESRDLSASATTGSYLVPQGAMLRDVLFGIRYSSSIAGRARLWESPNGQPATFPTLTSEPSTAGVQIGENTGMADTNDPTFGRCVFGSAPIYSLPGLFRIGRALAQDAAVDIEGLVTEAIAWRISRATDSDFLTTALAGVTATSVAASQTALVYQDIVNLIYSIDLSARGSSTAALIVSPATAKALAGLKDSSLRPLLVDATYTVVSDNADQFGSAQSRTIHCKQIEGVPVLENRNLPAALTTGATVGIFADWHQAFVFRFVEASVLTLNERYADSGEIGYTGWVRCDGQVSDANAAVKLVMAP